MGLRFSITSDQRDRSRRGDSWSLSKDRDGNLTLNQLIDDLNIFTVQTTDEVLREEINDGFPKDYTQVTDGVVNKPYQKVDIRVKGTVDINAPASIEDIIVFTYEELIKRSKVLSGDYARSHLLLFNGNIVAESPSQALSWARATSTDDGDVLEFVNAQPYSRKLERFGVTAQSNRVRIGRTSRKSSNVGLKPNGVYFKTSVEMKKLFNRGIGRIDFRFIPGTSQISSRSSITRSTFAKDGRPYLYPSIRIILKQRSVRARDFQ